MNILQITNFILLIYDLCLMYYLLGRTSKKVEKLEFNNKELKEENEILRKELSKSYINEKAIVIDFAKYISENTPLIVTKMNIEEFLNNRKVDN